MHTPISVARAMVREADALLARHGLPSIGSQRLEVVDPATGPGIFLAAVLAHARGGGGRLVGIDVDRDASSRTRDAIERFARARGYETSVELRDALSERYGQGEGEGGTGSGSEGGSASDGRIGGEPGREGGSEGEGARAVLVIGNPPWAARRTGPSVIEALVRDLHVDEHGAPLRERRRGVLADAYVRFLRWAIDAVERAPGGGAIALVTNASYLDGPVHRGLRALLCSRLDEVSVIDLGGSALVAREPGVVDGNVFGVRPGAAILLAARRAGPRSGRRAPVSYRGLTGSVDDKLRALAGPGAEATPIVEPLASLRPRARASADYASWPSLADWLPFHAEGVQTNRDEHVIDVDRGALLARLDAMARGVGLPAARPHFDPQAAAAALRALRDADALERHVAPIAYRPFDDRFAFLHPSLCHRPRPALLAAMARSSQALVSVRKDRGALPWSHAALVRRPIDNCYLSARSSCRARAFPSHRADGSPNVASSVLASLVARGVEATPEEVLAYLAAVLSATSYTSRFASALALDYPRVPLPRDAPSFARLALLGQRIADILEQRATPVRARADRKVVRVGHHAFAAGDPPAEQLAEVRRDIDELVRAEIA